MNPTGNCGPSKSFPSSGTRSGQQVPQTDNRLDVDQAQKRILEELYPNNQCPGGLSMCNKFGTTYKNGQPVPFRFDKIDPKVSQERARTVEEFLNNDH
jgi:hypothetical protein